MNERLMPRALCAIYRSRALCTLYRSGTFMLNPGVWIALRSSLDW